MASTEIHDQHLARLVKLAYERAESLGGESRACILEAIGKSAEVVNSYITGLHELKNDPRLQDAG